MQFLTAHYLFFFRSESRNSSVPPDELFSAPALDCCEENVPLKICEPSDGSSVSMTSESGQNTTHFDVGTDAGTGEDNEDIIITDFDKLCSESGIIDENELDFQEVVRKKRNKQQQPANYNHHNYDHQRGASRAQSFCNNSYEQPQNHRHQQQQQQHSDFLMHSSQEHATQKRTDASREFLPVRQIVPVSDSSSSSSSSVSVPSGNNNVSPSVKSVQQVEVVELTLLKYLQQLESLQRQHPEDFPIEHNEEAKRAFLSFQNRLRAGMLLV